MSWYDALKDAVSVAQKADNLEMVKSLLDAQKEIQDLQQENFELKRELSHLRSEVEKEKSMIYDSERAVYYTTENGNRINYCPICWSQNNKQSPVIKWDNDDHYCHSCNRVIQV